MIVKPANEKELLAAIDLGADMHRESNFRNMEYDKEYLRLFLSGIIAQDIGQLFVLVESGEVVGLFVAIISPSFFGPDKSAEDLAVYIKPEARGMRGFAMLVNAYVDWAESKGAKRILMGNSAGSTNDVIYCKMMNKLGFDTVGSITKLR